MSNTVITNYTDLNGPSTKAESSVVVIVNKDGSLSVDQNLLGTLMGTDGSQGAGISVVRVGHEGKPDDATDSDSDDDKVPHITMSVDSYYDEPNSIIKYDSGAEMLQSLRIETRENSLLGFQNDHCYTLLTSPSQNLPQTSDTNYKAFEEPVIQITHDPPPKPIPSSKKITILEQQIIPKGKKIILNPTESSIILKGSDILNKPLPIISKLKQVTSENQAEKTDGTEESSSISSGDSIPDRDSDSDYKDIKDRSASLKSKKVKPRILKPVSSQKIAKIDPKVTARLKSNRSLIKKEIKEKIQQKAIGFDKKQKEPYISKEEKVTTESENVVVNESTKIVSKHTPKPAKKDKKTPSHVTALLSDMTSLFSTPDVIRRVSTDSKTPGKTEKDQQPKMKVDSIENKLESLTEAGEKLKPPTLKIYSKTKVVNPAEKVSKPYDLMAQLDDASLAQILQDTPTIAKSQPSITNANINSPSLAGPLSPTLDLLGGLQPEEEGLTEDLLMHVAQLVESSENLQEVIDKQVLGKVDPIANKQSIQPLAGEVQDVQTGNVYTPPKSVKNAVVRKEPIEIVRKDGRVIKLPPIEAPATRSSKRKSQIEPAAATVPVSVAPTPAFTEITTPEVQAQILPVTKQFSNKKVISKKPEPELQSPSDDKMFTESQDSWNSEDDPYRLWCICRQPHNNRFMICCDSCEDWFHGKCVNITKAMGQQMEEQGIEWRCPNCVKKTKAGAIKTPNKPTQKKIDSEAVTPGQAPSTVSVKDSKTTCIVCKKPARPSSIYCSDACILKHAQDSLSSQPTSSKVDSDTGKPQDKIRMESRVIVYERKSGKVLAGPNAPTAENLKTWLQKHPTFEVVRPGTLSTIKPMMLNKKKVTNEPNKIQTTLNFERIPKKSNDPSVPKTPEAKVVVAKPGSEAKQLKLINAKQTPKEEVKAVTPKAPQPKPPQPKTPVATRSQQLQLQETPKQSMARLDTPRPSRSLDGPRMNMIQLIDTPKPGPPRQQDNPKPSTSKAATEPKKPVRLTSRSQSTYEKPTVVSPSTLRKKDTPDSRKMDSTEPIRENVRKALQEQITLRMSETNKAKFSEEEIQQFANDTELELYDLFSKDVGMKYKAKYRSLMFNIKDRKNLSLWQKICNREITPKQLVRLSPEELASQELAQWRDKEAKYQLELIKKSELDLLAASKTYVLKTHKGEEVMETKESVSTELDPNLPVEDLVTALNDSSGVQIDNTNETLQETPQKSDKKHSKSKESSKKSSRESKRDSDNRKSRSRRSDTREQRTTRRSEKKKRGRSVSKDRSKSGSKDKESERSSRRRSRSRVKSRRRSKSRDRSSSESQGRARSKSRARSRRSPQLESRRRDRSRSKRRTSDDKKTRSKSQDLSKKSKNDSTDSETLERPKSAMLKEVHPEYDPHEPMITSALSEEDLRKDSFEETFRGFSDVSYSEAFDARSFSIGAISPKIGKLEKLSEVESDQEPSSTVESSAATVWNGCINMVDVARFYVAAHEVSGSASDLEDDLAAELDVVGRINPETVWEYIGKMKITSNKDIVILRLQAANDEEQMQYIALYSYLSSRNRLGVVKVSNTATVKDIYIVPLPVNTPVPHILLPFDGPGLGDVKTHLLIAIIIRQRKKRLAAHLPKEVLPAKVARESRKRSYTPPVKGFTPPASPRRKQAVTTYTSPALSTSVKDKIAATLASAADDDEPYSPGSSTSSGGSLTTGPNTLKTKMEELNRQIEEQKLQIMKMACADSSVAEDEAYSPSRPMTPPEPVVPLANIALPSNLQEILATIKQRSETTDVDMRNLPPP